MLYIIQNDYFLSEYILEVLKGRGDIQIIRYERTKPYGIARLVYLAKRYLRAFVVNKRGLWTTSVFSHSFLSKLQVITANDDVLFWGCENLKELLMLNREIRCKKKNVFLWNPVETINRTAYSKWEYAHYLHRSGMEIFTFDKGDAIRYHFRAVKQVYRKPKTHSGKSIEYDVFYVGMDKNRAGTLEMLKDEFDKEHISYAIKIMKDKHSVISPKLTSCYVSSLIPYEETLAMAAKARCIVEILQKGQEGMTLRTLEAVFMGKKLITNNKDILHSSVYSPNNIYVTGYNETRSIREFLETPMSNLPPPVVESFDIEHWINQFL